MKAVVCGIVSVLILVGCGGPSAGSGSGFGDRSSAATTAVSPTAVSDPDESQADTLLDDLRLVVPALAGPTDVAALQRARDTCEVAQGVDGIPDPDGAISYLQQQATEEGITISAEQAEIAMGLMISDFCPLQ